MRTSFLPPASTATVASIILLFSLAACSSAPDRLTDADYAQAEKFLSASTSPLVYGDNVSPNWLADGRFWYNVTTREGHEFILASPSEARREAAFDHARLAASISEMVDTTYSAEDLPFRSVDFDNDARAITFTVRPHTYTCQLDTYACEQSEAERGNGPGANIPARFRRFASNDITSPDGTKEAFVRDFNLWVRDVATGRETQLTRDGTEDYGYATNNAGWTKSDRPILEWSPDSRRIATFRHDGRGVGMMYLVRTAAGHPELEAWKYPLPEDEEIFRIERIVADVVTGRVVRLNMPPDQHRSTITDHIAYRGGWADIDWSEDGRQLAFVSSSRDHKDAWLRVANPVTGAVTDIMHERQNTFFESGLGDINWRFLDASGEFLWWSQRSNWGHLYLVDQASGAIKNQITEGEWNVNRIVRIDEEARQIWFMGQGREAGDPYFQYLYRVDFDGTGLTLLTPEAGTHSVSFSPAFDYFVDTYSQPDVPPVSEVRTAEGELVMTLETADISDLLAAGWQAPTPFTVKGRDGATDLYGLMYTPTNLDEGGSYPVLNYVYPGPQTGSVGSRAFRASRSDKQAVAELGFVVVELDGMGTPGRSKSFHDTYYGNMGDNTLPDQITGIEQLAERHPYMDVERVGIWGHSGGGFATAAALFRHPDFYKVGVSGAGNHDNRVYEDDWGEKWQGLLTVNEDGTTNYDNQANQLVAHQLEGKLLIAHGMMDSNVPPYNTLLVVEALMDANKDFDLLVFPSSRHGFRQGDYWMRRRWDYFVRHLLGAEPPHEYQIGGD